MVHVYGAGRKIEPLVPGAIVARQLAIEIGDDLVRQINEIATRSPFRRVTTPSGKPMSVEITNCGSRGWVSDFRGYRYEQLDPLTQHAWPPIPERFFSLAREAASIGGYIDFQPDVCLINRYSIGSTMGMHQDRDERDFKSPIVSVSLGLPIRFRIGGTIRGGRTHSTMLEHGDVVVFGGPSRLAFHGVGKLRAGTHPVTGDVRYNLTFRVSQ